MRCLDHGMEVAPAGVPNQHAPGVPRGPARAALGPLRLRWLDWDRASGAKAPR